jgi:hypothetical protein
MIKSSRQIGKRRIAAPTRNGTNNSQSNVPTAIAANSPTASAAKRPTNTTTTIHSTSRYRASLKDHPLLLIGKSRPTGNQAGACS